MTFTEWVDAELGSIRAAGRWREVHSFDALGPAGVRDGRTVVSFASNDYLGLSAHPAVTDAAREAVQRWGTGATASRLVVGSRPVHHELERELADWKGTDAAVAFPTGYMANLGVLATFGGPDCLIVSDELNHASIIDGCRLSRSQVAVARHGDVAHVDELLRASTSPRAIVVSDAVFSMDGDEAPVTELAACCARHGALLVLDEAHAVLGPDTDARETVPGLTVLRVLTLSKALGALGGAVCGPAPLVDLLVNRARPFIFTTGSSPADTAAALAALRIVRGPEGDQLRSRLRHLVDRLVPGHPSPIVPLIAGEEGDAVSASAALLERGLLVPAIRPPTVPPGTSRLRVALSALHTDAMLDELLDGLAAVDLLPAGSAAGAGQRR